MSPFAPWRQKTWQMSGILKQSNPDMTRGGSFSGEAGIAPHPPQPSLARMRSVPPHHSHMGHPSVAPLKKLWTSPSFLYTDSALEKHTSRLKLIFFFCLCSNPPHPQKTNRYTKKQKDIASQSWCDFSSVYPLSWITHTEKELVETEVPTTSVPDSISGGNILLLALYGLFLGGMGRNSPWGTGSFYLDRRELKHR